MSEPTEGREGAPPRRARNVLEDSERIHLETTEEWSAWLERRLTRPEGVWLVQWNARSGRPATVDAIVPNWVYAPGTAEWLDQPESSPGCLSASRPIVLGTRADIVAATINWASESAGMVTGSVLVVDGGGTAL